MLCYDRTDKQPKCDGSAKSPNSAYSLNDCLQVGPNYIPQLFDFLLKFRWSSIALTADIEKAFLMVAMNEASMDTLRFLWFKDTNEHIPEVIQLRFYRLVFGLCYKLQSNQNRFILKHKFRTFHNNLRAHGSARKTSQHTLRYQNSQSHT